MRLRIAPATSPVLRMGPALLTGSIFLNGMAFAAPGTVPAPGAEVPAEGGLPQLDASTYSSQIFWLLVTFGILYLLCQRVFLPRIGGIIEQRRNRIADDFDYAAEFKREAEEAEIAYRKSLEDARARAAQIAADTRTQIDEEIARMGEETDAKLESDIAAAEERIAKTSREAAAAVREAARETTKALVAALIDETPSDETVDTAISHVNG